MLLEEGLYAFISVHPALTPTIGARLYPLFVPQGATLPAMTYRRARTTPNEDLNGNEGLSRVLMEFTIWGNQDDYLILKKATHDLRKYLLTPSLSRVGTVEIAGVEWLNEEDVFEETLTIPGVQSDYEFTLADE